MDLQKERLLVEDAKENAHSFGILFDTYYPAIYKYTLKRVGDAPLAQDIVAETFIKALQNIHKFKWKDVSISAWFYKIATNEIRSHYRKGVYQTVSLEYLQEINDFQPISEQNIHNELAEAQTLVERQAEFLRAQKVLANLPIKYQEVITLRFIEKKKLNEIALIIGKKEGTVKSLVSRGLVKLRYGLEQARVQPFIETDVTQSEGQLIMQARGSYEE